MMKTFTLRYLMPFMLLIFLSANAMAQCEPQDCPDPENNGEICPDTMPVAFLNQFYSQVATILVPEQDTSGVALHHLTLVAIDSLPPGITWESNAPGNEFMAGNDYCILLEGTPTVADTFFLRIVLDVYIDFFGQPIFVMQVVDSTSLFMVVVENTGMNERLASLEIRGNYPNPFSDWTSIRYHARQPGEVTFEVHTLMGQKVHEQKLTASYGENAFLFNGEELEPGTYLFVLRDGPFTVSKLMVRLY